MAVACTTVGCSTQLRLECAAGQQITRSEFLYFGTNKTSGGTVSDAEWQAFLAEEVTPRFPDGLSVIKVFGQWKPSTGSIIVETAQVLNVIHLNDPKHQKAFAEIVASYKSRFSQESVLQVSVPACATL